ncbi:MAG: hypothetical protein ACYS0I_18795 [Planctomycetota bacterium]|jgi:hypothetical protein
MEKKRLLALALVLIISSVANATVIDVVADADGSKGHAGTIDDPLEVSEFIEIKLFLNHNPYPGYPSYDGYLLSSMETILSVSGPGSLEMRTTGGKNPLDWIAVPGNEIALSEEGLTLRGPADIPIRDPFHMPGPDPPPIVDLRIVAEGTGLITSDLSINGTTHYWNYSNPSGGPYGPDYNATEGDLGDLPLYVAPTGDIDDDWDVDLPDLSLLAAQWKKTGCGQCGGADITGDGNVDENDFGKFAANWLVITEPTLFYKVHECVGASAQGQQAASVPVESDVLRFSITVHGHFLLFEDLITANCDSDEIELQMTVAEDNRITIDEIELTEDPMCQCEHPTTATLGPFPAGFYFIEVIDIDGTWLGANIVTIQ